MRCIRLLLMAVLIAGPCALDVHAGPFKRLFKGKGGGGSAPPSQEMCGPDGCPGLMPPGFQALTPLAGQATPSTVAVNAVTPTAQAGRVVYSADEVPASQVIAAPAPPAKTSTSVAVTTSSSDTVATLTAQMNAMSEQLAVLRATAAPAAPVPTPAVVTTQTESSVVTTASEARFNRMIDAVADRLGIENEVDPPQTPARDVVDSAGQFTLSLKRPGQPTMETTIDLSQHLREQLGSAAE